MASKKKKRKNKIASKSEMEARMETKVVTSEAILYQAFRDLSSPGGIASLKKIAIQMDNAWEGVALWKGIRQVFPNVLCVKDGDTDVTFLMNDNSENTEPVDITMPALESLSLEIDTIKKPCRHDPRGRDRDGLTDAQRSRKEKEAWIIMVRHISPCINPLSGAYLKALTTLAYSDKLEFRKTAAKMFAGEVVKDEKKCKLAVELEPLKDLNRLLRAITPDVHWAALMVFYKIIQTESLRVKVAKSGVIDPLFPLALSENARVPRIVAATFFEVSCTGETRRMVVEAGAIPVLIRLLDSFYPDVQLAFAQDFRIKILQGQVLLSLFHRMGSSSYEIFGPSMRCIVALSSDLSIGSTGVEAGIVNRIVELILYKGHGDSQYDAVFTLITLAHNEQNARAIIEAGAVDRICALVSQATLPGQSEMGLRPRLDHVELFKVLIPLSLSPKEEVWKVSVGAILQMIDTKDYLFIAKVWNTPLGGLRECFVRSLRSDYGTIQSLVIHTIFKWLEDGDHAMKNLIAGSPEIVARINEIANDPEACAPIPSKDRRDTAGLDPIVVTMVQAGSIVETLAMMREEKKKNNKPSATPQPQSFRLVSSSGSPTTSPTIKIRSVLDSKREANYILWEDIQQQFGNVQYVMKDGTMILFMRDANFEEIFPLRIKAHHGVTLEVVLQESEQDVDDDCSSMPDLELLSIADPDLNHGVRDVHPGGSSNAQNQLESAQDIKEVKAVLYLERNLKKYNHKNAKVADILRGEHLRNLSIVAFSNTMNIQQCAAEIYHAISTKDVGPVSEDALRPLLHLLQSNDLVVQRAATTALLNLLHSNELVVQKAATTAMARLPDNVVGYKSKIVGLGAIEPLIRLMLSPDIAVRCDAAGCICSLAQEAEVVHTSKIVRLGALTPLVRLIQCNDVRVQTNATGALNNISDCEELVGDVVKSGAVPFLIRLLGPGTPQNIQQECAEALCNITFNEVESEHIYKTKTKLVTFLVKLIDATDPLLQRAVTRLLSALSTNLEFQGDLIKKGGIPPLLRLLESDTKSAVLSPICCLYNIAVDPNNKAHIAEPRIIKHLVDLQTRFKDEEINDRAVRMLLALSNYRENHKIIVDAGVAEHFCSSVSIVSKDIQELMTILISRLGSALDTKSKTVRLKLVDALIRLTKSSSEKLQMLALDAMAGMASILPNHLSFQEAWHGPDHNLQEFLCRMLDSTDTEILVRGLLAFAGLLENGGIQMMNLVSLSNALKPGNTRVCFIAMGVIPAPEGVKSEMVLPLAKK
ncbi:Vacuolar protein 8, partial [Mortierella sp. AM989]